MKAEGTTFKVLSRQELLNRIPETPELTPRINKWNYKKLNFSLWQMKTVLTEKNSDNKQTANIFNKNFLSITLETRDRCSENNTKLQTINNKE